MVNAMTLDNTEQAKKSTLEEIIAHEIWGDLDEERSFPQTRPLLAHYTSIQNVENILRGKELWLSNPLLMNDLEELKFGVLEGAKLFRESTSLIKACEASCSHAALIAKFDEYVTALDTRDALDIYIFCFSLHTPNDNDGRLSMWRGYGNNGGGAALVFDTAKFDPVEDSPLTLSPVIYANTADRLNWIRAKIDKIAEIISSGLVPTTEIPTLSITFFLRLLMFSLHTKHEGFKEEKEWRLVYISTLDTDGHGKSMLSYHNSDRGIEPKLKLKLTNNPNLTPKDFNLDSVIHQIILGPTASSLLSAKALERMIDGYGLFSLSKKITPSSIPYRPT